MPTYADISRITLPSGATYNIKDAGAREMIAALENFAGFLGVTTTQLVDGVTTSPVVVINGDNVTAASGSIVIYGNKEFIYTGTVWQEFGDMSGLGALAFKSNASTGYTPAGSVSQPTFTGTALTSTGSFTPAGTIETVTNETSAVTAAVSPTTGDATYTPSGNVSAPTVVLDTTTITPMATAGTLPSLSMTVAENSETLVIEFSQGTLPTPGTSTTVATGTVTSVSAPTFTGNGVRLVTAGISVPSSYTSTFTGTAGAVSVSGTPAGTVSQPTFTGTSATITVS